MMIAVASALAMVVLGIMYAVISGSEVGAKEVITFAFFVAVIASLWDIEMAIRRKR